MHRKLTVEMIVAALHQEVLSEIMEAEGMSKEEAETHLIAKLLGPNPDADQRRIVADLMNPTSQLWEFLRSLPPPEPGNTLS